MAKKVLIVEDEPEVQEVERMVVEDLLGCEVTLASSGEEALELVSGVAPDLVMLDLVLPGIDGFTVAERMRTQPELDRTRILALSGLTRPEDRERARAAGCNDVLDKPFDLDDLMKKIEGLVGTCTPTN
ncbi:MAG TPA: response regulator [Chloroflexota bacterium]|nr:response regulator [Chloroflexota bacterium]